MCAPKISEMFEIFGGWAGAAGGGAEGGALCDFFNGHAWLSRPDAASSIGAQA
jgi:hypothetical protein